MAIQAKDNCKGIKLPKKECPDVAKSGPDQMMHFERTSLLCSLQGAYREESHIRCGEHDSRSCLGGAVRNKPNHLEGDASNL